MEQPLLHFRKTKHKIKKLYLKSVSYIFTHKKIKPKKISYILERGPIWPTTKSCQLLGTPCNIKPPPPPFPTPPKKDSPYKTLFFFQKFLWDIPSHIIQPWHHLPQNFFQWTAHEIWLKTKINLQFQLYCSWGTHFFRLRKFIQKQEI